jgi:hypothetical protein
MVVSYAGDGTVFTFKPDEPDSKITLLKAVPAEPRPGMTAVVPVDYWRNENDFAQATLRKHDYQFISPDRTTFLPSDNDFVSGELYYGSKLNNTLRAFGFGRAVPGQPFYVSDENGEKTYEATIGADGTITSLKLFVDQGGEGVATDEKGNVYIAAGEVHVYNSSGKLIDTISVPERPSQLLFGGEDGHTLFILARSSLYAVRAINRGR